LRPSDARHIDLLHRLQTNIVSGALLITSPLRVVCDSKPLVVRRWADARAAWIFDVDDTDLGGQLKASGSAVDFENFLADLVSALAYSDGAPCGGPPFDPVMMLKIHWASSLRNPPHGWRHRFKTIGREAGIEIIIAV
jgi:hypothetical protein